jgi:glucose-1-phosphate adenylyltransferase
MNGMHGIIFSYESRNDLKELVDVRSAASVPFGGRYRMVDFALSNLVNAGVTDVGVVLHGRYQSMIDHLGSGKVWDLSRKRGGLRILPPFNYQKEWGVMPFRGKVEALAGVRSYLDEIRQDYVVLMEGDLVVNLPLAEIQAEHVKSGADITVVCGNDSFATADGSYFEVDQDGRITEVLYNMNTPRGYRGLEVYILSTKLLKELVDECYAKDQFSWRRDVLRAKKDDLKLNSYIWSGFAAQVRSVQEYYDRSMQLLDPKIRAELFTPARPIMAKGADKSSTYVGPDGRCVNSMVAEGCRIEGVVENSILFPGVVVEKGAVVRNCVLFKESAVGKNAQLSYIIADKYVEVLEGRTLMGHATYPIVLSKGSKV